MNAAKSQVLTISPQQHVQEVTVKSGDCLLPSASSARYLGVHLDNCLDWDTLVNYVVTTVAKKIGALWRARRSLARRSCQVYVKVVIMPDLLYGACCFSAAMREGQLKPLRTVQNRAIRCIDGSPGQPCSRCSLPVPCQRAPQAENNDHHLALYPHPHQPCARPASDSGTRHPYPPSAVKWPTTRLVSQANRSLSGDFLLLVLCCGTFSLVRSAQLPGYLSLSMHVYHTPVEGLVRVAADISALLSLPVQFSYPHAVSQIHSLAVISILFSYYVLP